MRHPPVAGAMEGDEGGVAKRRETAAYGQSLSGGFQSVWQSHFGTRVQRREFVVL